MAASKTSCSEPSRLPALASNCSSYASSPTGQAHRPRVEQSFARRLWLRPRVVRRLNRVYLHVRSQRSVLLQYFTVYFIMLDEDLFLASCLETFFSLFATTRPRMNHLNQTNASLAFRGAAVITYFLDKFKIRLLQHFGTLLHTYMSA
jgi:hypothetical protein